MGLCLNHGWLTFFMTDTICRRHKLSLNFFLFVPVFLMFHHNHISDKFFVLHKLILSYLIFY